MSNPLPKLDETQKRALLNLRSHSGFQSYHKHLLALFEYNKAKLVTALPADVLELQGRAKQLQDLLDLMKE